MRKVGFALFLLVAAMGCKKGPVVVVADPGPYQAPQGATIAKSSDGLVSVLVPSDWKRGGPGSMVMPSFGEMVGGMGSESMGGNGMENLAQQMQQDEAAADAQTAAELEKKGILIWVNNSSRPIPGEERTSYRIKRTDDGPKSLEDAATAAKDGIMGEGPIQYVDLPIGKVARMEAKVTKVDGGELYQIVYVIVNGDHIYNVRFTTQEAPTTIQQIEKEVMESLRITPAKAG